MPAPVLPQKKVEQLLRQGLGPSAIARILETEDFIKVTPESISMFRNRRGLQRSKARYTDLLPWTIQPAHRNLYVAKCLRLEGQRRAGGEMSAAKTAELQRRLDKLADEDVVVHYDPDTEAGWFYVPRRHGIDEDLIRNPEVE